MELNNGKNNSAHNKSVTFLVVYYTPCAFAHIVTFVTPNVHLSIWWPLLHSMCSRPYCDLCYTPCALVHIV